MRWGTVRSRTGHDTLARCRGPRYSSQRAGPAAPYFPAWHKRMRSTMVNVGLHRLRAETLKTLDLHLDAEVLLVIGGSQGATTLNRAAVGLARLWRDKPGRFILLKTGAADLAGIQADLQAAD